MISSHQIQTTDSLCKSDVTTSLYPQELTNVHPQSRARLSTICQFSSHTRHCSVYLRFCGWVDLHTYVHVCLTGCLLTSLIVYICLVIWKFLQSNGHIFSRTSKQTVWHPPVFPHGRTYCHMKAVFFYWIESFDVDFSKALMTCICVDCSTLLKVTTETS